MAGGEAHSTLWYNGVPVVIDDLALRSVERVQVRFPRSKRARVRRKWRKDARNWQESICWRNPFWLGGMLIISSHHLSLLREATAAK